MNSSAKRNAARIRLHVTTLALAALVWMVEPLSSSAAWNQPTLLGDGIYFGHVLQVSGTLRESESEWLPPLAIDGRGALHVVRIVVDYSPHNRLAYNAREIYHARSANGGETRSEPLAIDQVDSRDASHTGRQPDWGAVAVDAKARIHLEWVGSPDMRRYHQYSSDGRITWTPRQVAIDAGGYNGWLGLAAELSNNVYLIAPSLEGIAYARWNEGTWSPATLVPVSAGAHITESALALGRRLHAVWQNHDVNRAPGRSASVLWSELDLGGQELLPVAPSTQAAPTAQPRTTRKETAPSPPQNEARPQIPSGPTASPAAQSGISEVEALALGVLPAAGLVALVVAVQVGRRQR